MYTNITSPRLYFAMILFLAFYFLASSSYSNTLNSVTQYLYQGNTVPD